ncbi:hypothetical protein AAMO2058_000683500 [Amorphochlora amoebiformis]
MAYRFRLRIPGGQSAVIQGINSDAKVSDLAEKIKEVSKIAPSRQMIKFGYPPAELKSGPNTLLSASGIRSGVTIMVSEGPPKPLWVRATVEEKEEKNKGKNKNSSGSESKEGGWAIKRVVVPDDNSCLFTAVGYVCESPSSMHHSSTLRQICASLVISSSDLNEALLGKPPSSYAQELLNPNKWGGAIELSLLRSPNKIRTKFKIFKQNLKYFILFFKLCLLISVRNFFRSSEM